MAKLDLFIETNESLSSIIYFYLYYLKGIFFCQQVKCSGGRTVVAEATKRKRKIFVATEKCNLKSYVNAVFIVWFQPHWKFVQMDLSVKAFSKNCSYIWSPNV